MSSPVHPRRGGWWLTVLCGAAVLSAAQGTAEDLLFTAPADDPQAGQQRHQLGDYAIAQPGVPAPLYFDLMREYRRSPTDAQSEAQRRGDPFLKDPKNPNPEATWQVHCPQSYTPDDPHGVLVFIHAADSGHGPPAVKEMLERHKLISIGADHSGNQHDLVFRHAYAVHAVDLLRRRYHLDEDRIYVYGISGGGRMSSHVAFINADTFDGAVCVIGCNPYKMIPADKGPNTVYRGFWPAPDRRLLKRIRDESRLVLLTGENDGNRHGTLQVYKAYERENFKHLLYLEEPGLGHEFPSAEYFERGLTFLDAPLYAAAEEHYRAAVVAEGAGDLGTARMGYVRAANHGRDAAWRDEARQKAREYQGRYRQELAEVKALFDAGARNGEVARAINGLRRTWGESGQADVDRLRDRLRNRTP